MHLSVFGGAVESTGVGGGVFISDMFVRSTCVLHEGQAGVRDGAELIMENRWGLRSHCREKRAIIDEERRLKALLDLEKNKLHTKEDFMAAVKADKHRREAKEVHGRKKRLQ
jgi:hypothetical protein